MRFSILVAVAVAISACAKLDKGPTIHSGDAGEATFNYAFSAQVRNDDTREAVTNFSVAVASDDQAVAAVLNGLGDKHGLFHISRVPSTQDNLTNSLPVVVTAPGFEPVVQMVDVGADCQGTICVGIKPIFIDLKPLLNALDASKLPPISSFDPAKLKEFGDIKALFKAGKLDTLAATLLSQAASNEVLSNIVVILDGKATGKKPEEIVAELLAKANNDKLKDLAAAITGAAGAVLPFIAAASPEVSAALLAANALMPYLVPVLGQFAGQLEKAGPFGAILAGVIKGMDPQAKPGAIEPFSAILANALKDPNLAKMLESIGKGQPHQALTQLFTNLQPLMQGLMGKQSPELAALFNELVKNGGVNALKDFTKLKNADKYAKLAPFIEPLVKGLNGKDAKALVDMLKPLVAKKDPAAALKELLANYKGGLPTDATTFANMAATLFPNVASIMKEAVPGKQVFAAQLMQGLINGNFTDMKVIQDFQGAPVMILSGQAKDLLKIAQLPNVERVTVLEK